MDGSSTAAQKSLKIALRSHDPALAAPRHDDRSLTGALQTRSALALWHLCSLDAPSVATLWTIFIADVSGVRLSWSAPTGMFLAVWILYAADRILDARNALIPGEHLEVRHLFHNEHRKIFIAAMAFCSLWLGALVVTFSAEEVLLFSALAILLLAYLILIHVGRPGEQAQDDARLPKEFAVGAFFAAAVFIPTVARQPNEFLHLLPSAALFGIVCTLNCLFVYAWEHPEGASHAHWSTRAVVRHLRPATWLSVAIALVLLIAPSATHVNAPTAIACALCLLCFLILHKQRGKLSKLTLRALVDFVLLAPLPILIFRDVLLR